MSLGGGLGVSGRLSRGRLGGRGSLSGSGGRRGGRRGGSSTGHGEPREIVDLTGVIVVEDLNGVVRLSREVGRRSPCVAARVGNVLGNGSTRVRSHHSTPLELQGDGAAGGRLPGERSRLTSLERITLRGDVERVGTVGSSSSERRHGAESQVEDGTHFDEIVLRRFDNPKKVIEDVEVRSMLIRYVMQVRYSETGKPSS